MTPQETQEMFDFYQKLKGISSVDFVELIKAHIHNGNDFPKIKYGNLDDTPTIPEDPSIFTATAGESLSANDAVIIASGNYISNTITQTSQNANFHTYGTNWSGQTFTTGANTKAISGLTVRLGKVGSLGLNHHIFIYPTSGGLPTGSPLVDSLNGLGASFNDIGEYTVTFSTPVAVNPNTVYAFIIDFYQGDSSNYVACYYNSSSAYANGNFISTTDAGANWTADTNKDLYFKVYETYHIAGQVYKANGTNDDELANNFIGFATTSVSAGDSIVVKIGGVSSGFSSLLEGKAYYLSTTSGLITTTKTRPKTIGISVSDTEILIGGITPVNFLAVASDNLKASADFERSKSGAGYAKVKEMTVAISGVFRIKFDLKQDQISTAYGRIYRNGVAWGTEQTQTGTTYVTKSEDLIFSAGDKIQLYLNCSGGGYNTLTQNFRIYYDKNIVDDITVDTN